MQSKIKFTSWFTLVELIVVITIIGILSTIGFVSYSGYLTWARDSNRISQLTKLSDSLQVYSATRTLPLPDDYVEVTASGASNVIAYQGYLWVDVLETLDYVNGWQDPKDDIYFTYYLTKDRKSLQLLALMEEEQSVTYNGNSRLNIANVTDLITPKVNAATYEDRFPKVYGRKLWVLTQVDTNTPIQELVSVQTATRFDVVDETWVYVAHVSDDINDKIEWTGTALRAIIPNGSCNRIKQTWGASGNGRYTINPGWAWDILVYCDMETAWGGWTLIARSFASSPISFWSATGNINADDAAYVLWPVTNFSYSRAMVASYNGWKSITGNNTAAVTSPISSYTEWTHTLATAGISWGTLTWDGMFFIK